MTVRNLDRLFDPSSIALIGGSRRERSVGQLLARNLVSGGFEGADLASPPRGRGHRGSAGLQGRCRVAEAAGPRGDRDPAGLRARPDRRVGRARHQGGGGDLGRIRRGRQRGRRGAASGNARCGRAAPAAHQRAELRRHPGARHRSQRQLRAYRAAARRRRLRHPVGGHGDLDARLDGAARYRLLPYRLAGRHGRRRLRRCARLSRRRLGYPLDPALHRGGDPRPQVHVGAARGGAHQAGNRYQGRPPCGIGQGCGLPHWRAGRLRRGLRRRLPACRCSARVLPGGTVRRSRDPGRAAQRRRRPPRHPDQRRRAWRTGDRRAGRPGRASRGVGAGDGRGARRLPAADLEPWQPGRHHRRRRLRPLRRGA